MQYWREGAIFDVQCPECGVIVEFYKDDTTRKCHKCDLRFVNPKMDFGCAAYCQFAEQCLGTLPEDFVVQQDNLLKDKVAVEMKRYFKTDFGSIGHAVRVARYAEEIAKATEGTNIALVLCSAYLHNIGKFEAEKKHGSKAPEHLQLEGPAVARNILEKLGADENLVEDVCTIISYKDIDRNRASRNIVHDASLIVTLEDEHKKSPISAARIKSCLENDFLSEGGQLKAGEAFTSLESVRSAKK